MLSLTTLIYFLLILIGLAVILGLIYYAIMQVPWFTPWAWAVRAVFALIVALVLVQLFFGGGFGTGSEGLHLRP